MTQDGKRVLARLPVSRGRGLLRSAVRLLFGAIIGFAVIQVCSRLSFVPTGASNRITDYAVGVALVPFALLALWLLGAGLRWSLLCVWPGQLRIEFTGEALEFHLGPFGRSRFDTKRLDVRYPHELDPDDADEPFEALEDPQDQEQRRVPRMTHPDQPQRLDWLIGRFVDQDEAALARTLRPFVQKVRGDALLDGGEDQDQ